jgi:hypothetical protein
MDCSTLLQLIFDSINSKPVARSPGAGFSGTARDTPCVPVSLPAALCPTPCFAGHEAAEASLSPQGKPQA